MLLLLLFYDPCYNLFKDLLKTQLKFYDVKYKLAGIRRICIDFTREFDIVEGLEAVCKLVELTVNKRNPGFLEW